MVCCSLRNTIRDRMKAKVEKIAEIAEKEDVKAAAKEYLDTFACGATNGTATDKLVAALEGCGCDLAEKKRSSQEQRLPG